MHSKQHIPDLAAICRQKGVVNCIISPGSRNAPLIEAFYAEYGEDCISIVDERSAAYVALGIARYWGKPVALLSTSGTAGLNYAPAVAEAYYQQVPLLVLTADRPGEWIDQLDNQSIHQTEIYKNFCKAEYTLPSRMQTDDDLWFAHRIINQSINECTLFNMGPVHINIPLCEPLYETLPTCSEKLSIIDAIEPDSELILNNNLRQKWQDAKRILIVQGQNTYDNRLCKAFNQLLTDKRVVLIAENITNCNIENSITSPDLVFSNPLASNLDIPDLLIVTGGQVVSKRLKIFLRNAQIYVSWRVGRETAIIDTYKHITDSILVNPVLFFEALAKNQSNTKGENYQKQWNILQEKAQLQRNIHLQQAPFSDLVAFNQFLQKIPNEAILEMGNSTSIRYSQLFSNPEHTIRNSNRGVSGIDGCLSSAVGTALASNRLTIAILGDLSFVYDSNALWNRRLPANLKIIVLNNSGGGIFHLLDGPGNQKTFRPFIEAHHPVNIHKLAEAFGVNYRVAASAADLDGQLNDFFKVENRASLLEIKTDAAVSATVFRKVMGK